ncbi:MAG: YacL family protein [Alteromonadaceae bacterium]|nr:YacL family protein [Alteromonadaceae bacterium]
MEYEFIHDPTTGVASARFSMEHENIGSWLEIELAKDQLKLTQLLTAIDDVETGKAQEVRITGREFSVLVEKNDVTIEHNSAFNDVDELPSTLHEDIHNDDFNGMSQCGLDDFHQLLLSWAKFIN